MPDIPNLNKPEEWLIKAKHNYSKYLDSQHSYDLIDTLLTLNSLPEWVKNHSDDDALVSETIELLSFMGGYQKGYQEINPETLPTDIFMKMRFLRLFSNYSKHPKGKEDVPSIVQIHGNALPMVLDAPFGSYLCIGDIRLTASSIVKSIIDYWEERL